MTSGNWDAYRKAETALKKCPDMLTRIRECITENRVIYVRSPALAQDLTKMHDDLFVTEFAFRALLLFCDMGAALQNCADTSGLTEEEIDRIWDDAKDYLHFNIEQKKKRKEAVHERNGSAEGAI